MAMLSPSQKAREAEGSHSEGLGMVVVEGDGGIKIASEA